MNFFSNSNNDKMNDSYESLGNENELRIDIMDEEDNYILYIDVPGLPKDSVKLKIKNEGVWVKVDPPYDDEVANSMIVQERIHESVERLIPLSEPIDKKSVIARLSDGVLVVQVKKLSEDDDSDLVSIG